MEAAARISRSAAFPGVDRVVSDARAETKLSGNSVTATGAAFRHKGRWFALQYTCTVASDHLTAKTLKFTIGKEIPEDRWEDYGLWQ